MLLAQLPLLGKTLVLTVVVAVRAEHLVVERVGKAQVAGHQEAALALKLDALAKGEY